MSHASVNLNTLPHRKKTLFKNIENSTASRVICQVFKCCVFHTFYSCFEDAAWKREPRHSKPQSAGVKVAAPIPPKGLGVQGCFKAMLYARKIKNCGFYIGFVSTSGVARCDGHTVPRPNA